MIAYFWKLVWSLFWSNCWSLFWSLLWSIFIPQIFFNFYSTNKFAKIFTKIFLNGKWNVQIPVAKRTKCFSIKNIFIEIFLCVLFWIQKQNIYLKILLSKKVFTTVDRKVNKNVPKSRNHLISRPRAVKNDWFGRSKRVSPTENPKTTLQKKNDMKI